MRYVGTAFPEWTATDRFFSSCVLFWGKGGPAPTCLSIGAPTSPLISNVIMYDFDSMLAKFCIESGLVYTRYADDITISSTGYLDMNLIIDKVSQIIGTSITPKLKINENKTIIVSKSKSRRVTGLVITNDGLISLGHERKRLIRAMTYRATQDKLDLEEKEHLAGMLAFAQAVEPAFVESLMSKYRVMDVRNLIKQIRR